MADVKVPVPLASWYKSTNGDEDQLTRWDIGVVDASQASEIDTFLIFNNRKGLEDVPDMQNAVIMTKDSNGGNTGELVEGQWIEVRVDEIDTGFNKIGWDSIENVAVSRPIKTTGSTTNVDGTFTPNVGSHTTTSGEVSLLGVKNDGDLINAKGNYVKVQLLCRIPGNASSGLINFRTRITYQYV